MRVDYKSPSRERLFLESGWGLRDVRGVYLNANEGRICISPCALSPVKRSVVTLKFGMSKRAVPNAVSIQANGDFGVKSCFLERNKEAQLMIENIVGHGQHPYVIRVIHPSLPLFGYLHGGFEDILTLDELKLSR